MNAIALVFVAALIAPAAALTAIAWIATALHRAHAASGGVDAPHAERIAR